MNLKMPYGISNYEKIVNDGYYYVDKTKYIEKLENLPEISIMFLRPRKFGKTLFTSVLENYYDKNKVDKFENLYKNTYIGKKPTKLKNTYCILRFNFSGINTEKEEPTMIGFKENVSISIDGFAKKYGIDFFVNQEQTTEGIMRSLIEAFKLQKPNEKIYVIIDEYDHFANELLGFYLEHFKNLVSKNGRIRKWYEVLKEGTETVIDRIFITGVAPITLDSLTSGFNIGTDITQDEDFNDMMGFTKTELIEILDSQEISKDEQEKILPIMKENYDGYKFSLKAKNEIYNSNMCLYFLNRYIEFRKIPDDLVDMNIADEYNKIKRALALYNDADKIKMLSKIIKGEPIINDIVRLFNPAIEFTERHMISMLYYLGYLTISGEFLEMAELRVPNNVIKELYDKCFMYLKD